MSVLIRQSNYLLYLGEKQYPFMVEELVSGAASWPEKFRASFAANRAGQAASGYGKTELQAAESFVNKIKESYKAT
ncbi:MAG: hypothetical protein V3T23_02055 [Nitrososphaerales archaeon]